MSTRTVFVVALGCAVILAGAGTVWLQAGPGHPAVEPTSASSKGVGPSPSVAREVLNAELAPANVGKQTPVQRPGEVRSELDARLAGLTRGRPGGALPSDGDAPPVPGTPEELREQADARIQLQMETLDGAMRAEQANPGAQASLQQGFQRAAIEGLQLANAQCGATLCRMELTSDGSETSDNTFRSLSRIAPWSGQGFARIDSQSGNIIVYVATEGHTLPH